MEEILKDEQKVKKAHMGDIFWGTVLDMVGEGEVEQKVL